MINKDAPIIEYNPKDRPGETAPGPPFDDALPSIEFSDNIMPTVIKRAPNKPYLNFVSSKDIYK